MKRVVTLLISLLISTLAFAQSTDTVEYLMDLDSRRCVPEKSVYYRLAYRDGVLWKVKDYYLREKVKKSEGYFAKYENDTFTIRQGMTFTYHTNGLVANKVRYLNDKKQGVSKSYDTSGKLIDSAFYKNDIPYMLRYSWFSDGGIRFKGVYDTAATGIGEEWEYHKNGKLASYRKTIEGYKTDSIWTYYHENGEISCIEYYNTDSMTSIICYNENGSLSTDSCLRQLLPVPPYNVNMFFGENLRYPEYARDNNIQGGVYVQFTIEKDGTVSNVKSIGRVIGGGCDEEAVRVVGQMPKWKPGKDHNRVSSIVFTQRINFKLE